MLPEEVGPRLGELVPGAEPSVSGGQEFARATVDVPVAGWADALRAARDDPVLAMDFLDWLSAVDEEERGFAVVAHLWSTRRKHGVLIRTLVPSDQPELGSVVDIFPGAAWHERETHEMFGIGFAGHPGSNASLLLPPEFEGHPLRKDFVLAARVAKPWPGEKEPGQGAAGRGEATLGADDRPHGGGARRQPMRPPGVPAPGEWGPQAADEAAAGAGE